MAVRPIPEGFRTVTPYLVVDDAKRLLEFVKQAFGAQERMSMPTPDGKIGHAEVLIGDSVIMLADASTSDQSTPMPAMIHLYVDDVDKTFRQAIEAGASEVRALEDQFYGDRSGGVQDPAGNKWWIATHVEDVPPEEMQRRAEEYANQHPMEG
ncbi:MAG: VOC family protein [Actinomycetota bacterium]